jgi:penicillin-binding protein 1A
MTQRERQRRTRRRKTHHHAKRALIYGSLAILGALFIGVAGIVIWVVHTADSAPNISQLKPRVQGQVSEVYASNGKLLGYMDSDVVRTAVNQSQQPKLLRQATVAIEDRRFYQHGGVDYVGIVRAAVKDVLDGGGAVQGGSTLTMQLVDNVYLPTQLREEHDLKYKVVQAKLANELESKHSKDWILTQYLNDVPYGTVDGQSAIGVAAASQMFFDKNVKDIDLAQAALLAGLPQAPTSYNPFLHPQLARQRRTEVLQAMVSSGYITKAQARTAEASGLQLKANSTYQTDSQPYVFDYVREELVKKLGQDRVDAGGLKVYTTINLNDERYAQEALEENEGESDDPAAALATINPANGDIVAIAQNTKYGTQSHETTFDYATNAERQTGSSFKPFVLMTLINDDDGNPNDTYYNSHYLAPGWLPGYPTYSVHTAEESYQGDISVTRAMTISDNTVFAQLGVDLGMSKVDDTAHAMGITAPLYGYPSEAIGGLKIGVSPLQMADAYATLASGGYHNDETILAKVTFPDGQEANLKQPAKNEVFSYGETYAADQVLKTVVTEGTGTAASYGCPVAGKTGTTNDYTDAWFVGYTSELSTAVWVGYPNATTSMTDVNGLGAGYGGTLAAPIFRDYMEHASDGYCEDFAEPSDPWEGVAYHGAHTVSPYVAPLTTTTTTTTTTPTTTTQTPSPATTTPAATTPATTTPSVPPPAAGGSPTGGGGI